MDNCIFCKIVKGEIPSYTIYEDDLVKVFMDVNPVTNGHMLIIPKKHYENIVDVDSKIINHSVELIKNKFYTLTKEKLNCEGLSISQNNGLGQEVKHFHIHIIPRYEHDHNEENTYYNKDLLKSIDEVYEALTK